MGNQRRAQGPEAEGGTDGETLAEEDGVRIVSLVKQIMSLYPGGPDQSGALCSPAHL